MILLRKPEPYRIRRFLDDQVCESFNYDQVGATRRELPLGFAVNRTRRPLGMGELVFSRARKILENWRQLQLGWVQSWPTNAPLKSGQNIAIIGHAAGLWWLNACRIVYVEEANGASPCFGYAVGTLSDHLLCGEERYVVEMEADGSVWVEILAFSRPNKMLAKLAYPAIRRAQRKFGRESSSRLFQLVESLSFSTSDQTVTTSSADRLAGQPQGAHSR